MIVLITQYKFLHFRLLIYTYNKNAYIYKLRRYGILSNMILQFTKFNKESIDFLLEKMYNKSDTT